MTRLARRPSTLFIILFMRAVPIHRLRQAQQPPLSRTRLFTRSYTLRHGHTAFFQRFPSSRGSRADPFPLRLGQREERTQLRIFSLEQVDAFFESCQVFGTTETKGALYFACAGRGQLVVWFSAAGFVSVLERSAMPLDPSTLQLARRDELVYEPCTHLGTIRIFRLYTLPAQTTRPPLPTHAFTLAPDFWSRLDVLCGGMLPRWSR